MYFFNDRYFLGYLIRMCKKLKDLRHNLLWISRGIKVRIFQKNK